MIDIHQYSFAYQQKNVLTNVSAHFPYKDFCTIIGPNGAGKSTLLKSILKLTDATAPITIKGKPLQQYTHAELAKEIAFVPQRFDTVFDFIVEEIVMMGRHPHQSLWRSHDAADQDCVEQALRTTHTASLRGRPCSQLSGGELQRVLIARAIAQQTPILLLDEPLSNLDVAHQFDIMEILERLNREQNTTILMVVHDFAIARQFAKNALLLKNGEVLAQGHIAEMLTEQNLRALFDLSPTLTLDSAGHVYRNRS